MLLIPSVQHMLIASVKVSLNSRQDTDVRKIQKLARLTSDRNSRDIPAVGETVVVEMRGVRSGGYARDTVYIRVHLREG